MSLPLTARWEYNQKPEKGTEEYKIIEVLKKPKNWIVDKSTLKDASFNEILEEVTRRAVKVKKYASNVASKN